MRGDPLAGPVAQDFLQAYHKVDTDIKQRTEQKMLQVRELLYDRLLTWTKSSKNIQDFETKTGHRQLIDAVNALNKAYPQINVESYTWKVGMSTEEALNEFKRLTSVAREATIRRRVSGPISGRSEQIPDFTEQTNEHTEDPQAPFLRADKVPEELPPESGTDKGDIRGE